MVPSSVVSDVNADASTDAVAMDLCSDDVVVSVDAFDDAAVDTSSVDVSWID